MVGYHRNHQENIARPIETACRNDECHECLLVCCQPLLILSVWLVLINHLNTWWITVLTTDLSILVVHLRFYGVIWINTLDLCYELFDTGHAHQVPRERGVRKPDYTAQHHVLRFWRSKRFCSSYCNFNSLVPSLSVRLARDHKSNFMDFHSCSNAGGVDHPLSDFKHGKQVSSKSQRSDATLRSLRNLWGWMFVQYDNTSFVGR